MEDIAKRLVGKTVATVTADIDSSNDGNPSRIHIEFTDGSSVTWVAVEGSAEIETVYGFSVDEIDG